MCACVLSCFSHVRLFEILWTVAPGSSVHGILQASNLEWVAIPFSRASSWPRDRTHISYVCLLHWQAGSLPLAPPGKPLREGRHSGCKRGSNETDHFPSKRLILITPARAEKDLSIKASRTRNSQIPLKGPPWAFFIYVNSQQTEFMPPHNHFINLKKMPE